MNEKGLRCSYAFKIQLRYSFFSTTVNKIKNHYVLMLKMLKRPMFFGFGHITVMEHHRQQILRRNTEHTRYFLIRLIWLPEILTLKMTSFPSGNIFFFSCDFFSFGSQFWGQDSLGLAGSSARGLRQLRKLVSSEAAGGPTNRVMWFFFLLQLSCTVPTVFVLMFNTRLRDLYHPQNFFPWSFLEGWRTIDSFNWLWGPICLVSSITMK